MTATKRNILIIVAAGVLAVLLIVLYITSNTTQVSGNWLTAGATSGITKINIYEPQTGRTLLLEKVAVTESQEDTQAEEGAQAEESMQSEEEAGSVQEQWKMTDDNADVSGDKMAPLLAALSYLKVAYEVEGDGAQYGLDSPSAVVDVQYADKEESFLLGDSVEGRGTYMKKEGEDTVYMLDEGRAQTLLTAVTSFWDIALDQVDLDNIIGMNIYTPENGEIRTNRSEVPRAEGDYFWKMYVPYACNVNIEDMEALAAIVRDIGHVQKTGDVQAREEYGLADEQYATLTLFDKYDKGLELQLGKQEGDIVYCAIAGLDGIYSVDAAILQLLDTDPLGLVDPALFYYEVPLVTTAVFTWEDGGHVLYSEYVEDESTEKQYLRFELDGQTVSGGTYRELVAQLADIKIEVDPIEKGEGTTEIGAIVCERRSLPERQSVEFWEIDGRDDVVGVSYDGGRILGTIEKSEILAFLGQMEDLQAAKE